MLYHVFGTTVMLEPMEGVFMPSPNGLFYARSIPIVGEESVIDIGTGSGVLAIAAAKQGATVLATDIDPRAVVAARQNAERNGVTIDARVGSLFAGAEGPFDVILANLPNEIVPSDMPTAPDAGAASGFVARQAFDGGDGGNVHLLALLAVARDYMHVRSRLYLGVHPLTDYHATLRAMLAGYSVRLIDLARLPAKAFVHEHLAFYQALDHAGIIHMAVGTDGTCETFGYVYELTVGHPAPGS